ncbi:MAG: hypothetical protein K0S20_775 [Patescibacteria group bacterium]|nr:hypothetical protein [Patescibacteria group bacterium]
MLVQIEKVTQSKGNSPYVELGNMAYWPTEGGIKGILAFDAQNTQFVKIPVREKRTFIGMKTKEMLYDEAQAYPADLYLIYKVGREALTFLGKDQAEQVRSTVKLVSQSS